ncbi:MAG: alanine racemase [Burkholderiales bacterium]
MAIELHPPLPAATLTIDLAALCANWRHLAAQGPVAGACAAVVKANGYGLGARPVAAALYAAGCRHFFVALVDEALHLRPHLPADTQLFVLHGALPGAEADCAAQQLIPVLNSLEQIERWRAQAARSGRRLPAALQVDTGMARLGLVPDEWARVDAQALQGIEPVLLMSHLVSAEDPADPINALQLQRFQTARRHWPGVPCSLANSSGVFLGPDWHFDILRPGAALYGVAPTLGRANPMRPVVRLQAPLIRWHRVEAGAGVGYNHIWQAQGPRHIATLSVGYADGWLRSLSNRASLRFQGQTVPLVGRVSMDTITVDVTDVAPDRLQPGVGFDLIDELHDINVLAAEAGTNAYEVLTSLGQRYHRNYLAP